MNYTLPYTDWLKLFSESQGEPLPEQFQAGLEREALRVNAHSQLAQTAHPTALGSALTHPTITTDFSEAQLELITPPCESIDDLLHYQLQLHAFSARRLPADERIWFQSMPPALSEAEIPIAQFGRSHSGRVKEIYRRGLALRYGKRMQVISGIHFNYSFAQPFWDFLYHHVQTRMLPQIFISENYLGLMRNYLRHCWLLTYLFGASPLAHPSFLQREMAELLQPDSDTLLGPEATSLRTSRLGYLNSSRCTYSINYNSLTDYLSGLYKAISTPCPSFMRLGVTDANGAYQQLNDNILQIENEHYALIRPKQPPRAGERPFTALRGRGIGYVEVRVLDVNPFELTGVSAEQLHFIRLFLLWCLLEPNPPISQTELERVNENQHWVSIQGRKPGIKLLRPEGTLALRDWGEAICEQLAPLAQLLDQGRAEALYGPLLEAERRKLSEPELTPSARVVADWQASGLSYPRWMQQRCEQMQTELCQLPLEAEFAARAEAEVAASWEAQTEREASEHGEFEPFLAQFLTLKGQGLTA